MVEVLRAIVPIFIVVAVGFVATKMKMFRREEIAVLSRFVVRVALPILIFLNVYGSAPSEIFRPTYLLTYTLSAAAMFGLAFLYVKARRGPTIRAAFMGLSMAGTNNGFIGTPIFLILFPAIAGSAIGMDMIVDNVFIIPFTLLIAEHATGTGSVLQRVLTTIKGVVSHPLMIAIIAALTLNGIGVEIPFMLERPLTLLANASTGAALFAVGGMLATLSLKGAAMDVAVSVAGKLLVMPAVGLGVLTGLIAIGLPDLPAELKAAAILTTALPTFSILPSLAEPYGEADSATASMMLGTSLSFVTMSGWMLVLQQIGWM